MNKYSKDQKIETYSNEFHESQEILMCNSNYFVPIAKTKKTSDGTLYSSRLGKLH